MATRTLEDLYMFNETTGTIDPVDYADVEVAVKSDVQEALGVTDEIVPSTPLGRMLEWLSIYFSNVLGLNVQNANQLLVSAAAGQQLDAMAQWFQLARKPIAYSRVNVTCFSNSDEDVVIEQGSRVRSSNGDIFESLPESDTIPARGSKNIEFEAIVPGPVPVVKGTVNIIDSAIAGWSSCTNPTDGVVGAEIETDESLRARIQSARTVAPGFIEAIKNAIEAALPGGASAFVIENNTGLHQDVHGVDMEEHSILVCVDGIALVDEARAVAQAIFDNKPCGTGYTRIGRSQTFLGEGHTNTVTVNADGSVSDSLNTADEYDVVVVDAYGNPYHVFFCKPIPLAIETTIVVQNRSYTGVDLIGDVQAAVAAWAAEHNFGCGEPVYASEIIKAVEAAVSGVVVVECTVSDGGSYKGTSYVEVDAVHKASFKTAEVSIFSR